MNTKNLLGILLLFLCAIGLPACSDDDETKELTPLQIEKRSYEVRWGDSDDIGIYNGSGNISLKVQNTDIIEASYKINEDYGKLILGGANYTFLGQIRVSGKQKGETSLTVTDNVTKETVELQIKVTDRYLSCAIQEGNHPALTKDITVFFVGNEAHDCYFFSMDHANNKLYDEPLAKGTYEFTAEKDGENNKFGVILTYASDDKGRFTDAAIVPSAHKFDMRGSDSYVYSVLKGYLGVDWDNLTKSSVPKDYIMCMNEIGTEYSAKGLLVLTQMPEGILE